MLIRSTRNRKIKQDFTIRALTLLNLKYVNGRISTKTCMPFLILKLQRNTPIISFLVLKIYVISEISDQ